MRVLELIHGAPDDVGGGVFDETILASGHELARWNVPAGDTAPLPDAFDAVLVLGGGMHPDEDARHPWLPGEAEFLRRALEQQVPVFGVCLGAQLIARAAGAPVGPASEPEIGWLPVELTQQGQDDPVLGSLPSPVEAFQWHWYTFGLPAGATTLATSRVAPQAYRIGDHCWAVQFHPEVTMSMIDRWIADEGQELPAGGEQLREQSGERIAGWNVVGRQLCSAFLEAAAGR